MLGNYDKCKVCGDRGIYINNICDECNKEEDLNDYLYKEKVIIMNKTEEQKLKEVLKDFENMQTLLIDSQKEIEGILINECFKYLNIYDINKLTKNLINLNKVSKYFNKLMGNATITKLLNER